MAVAGVAVGDGERAPGGATAQVLGGEVAAVVVFLFGPGATDVAGEAAFAFAALFFACGGVEVHQARRDEQGGDGVEQGGFAAGVAADDEVAAFADGDVVQAAEGTPVVHLEAAEAVLFAGKEGGGFHGSSSSAGLGSGAAWFWSCW